MNDPMLFQPLKLRGLTLPNRIVVSPMCQYSGHDGHATDWHLMHVGNLAISGPGLLIMEMTSVEARGRISPYCLGLWQDNQVEALKPVLDFCRRHSDTPMAVQIAHAGRKASCAPPWLGGSQLARDAGGWRCVAPSAIPFAEDQSPPRALDLDEIKRLIEQFAAATRRANQAGYDAIELHGAHGYLLHQFLSPLSNRREDDYGGELDNRMRLVLQIFDACRSEWPSDKPLGIRLSATDWLPDGWNLDQTIALGHKLVERGCDWIDVSSGGLDPAQKIDIGPGYQVPFASAVKKATGVTTMSVGLITEAQQAENILQSDQADLVALARGLLYDPRWAWHAAAELGVDLTYPNQYLRCSPKVVNSK